MFEVVSVSRYLEYAADIICDFLRTRNVSEVLFVPYALRKQVMDVYWGAIKVEKRKMNGNFHSGVGEVRLVSFSIL